MSTETRLPDGYEARGGCHNCVWLFVFREYGDSNKLYCTRGAPARPYCGSCALDELFLLAKGDIPDGSHKYEYREKMWEEWAAGREVSMGGVCPLFKENSDDLE